MLRKKIASGLLFTLLWLAAVTLLRWDWHFNLIWLWLGGLVGTFLLDIDHLLDIFFVHPNEVAKTETVSLLRQRKIREAVVFLADTAANRTKLIFHSTLAQVFFYGLCFWVLTSTGSLFVKGMVMAAGLHLLKDEVLLLISGQENLFRQNFFWQIKKELSSAQLKIFVILMLLVFLGLNLLLV